MAKEGEAIGRPPGLPYRPRACEHRPVHGVPHTEGDVAFGRTVDKGRRRSVIVGFSAIVANRGGDAGDAAGPSAPGPLHRARHNGKDGPVTVSVL